VRDLKAIDASMDAWFGRVEQSLVELKTLFRATLPHLATNAEMAGIRTELMASERS